MFVIGARGYQPSTYWYCRINYGSCSGCDTLQAIRGYEEKPGPTEVDGYMTLALHLLQKIRQMDEDSI